MVFPASALVKRELLTTLRSKRAFLLLVLAAGIIFVTVGIFLDQANAMHRYGGSAAVGSMIIGTLTIGLYITMLLSVPMMAANAIVTERIQGNYDLLTTTLIRPTGIILGKMAHIVGAYALLVIAVLPLVGVSYFFVGVEWMQILLITLTLFVAAVAACTLGLFVSTVVSGTRGAVFGTYFLLALFHGVAMWAGAILFAVLYRVVVLHEIEPPEWILYAMIPGMAMAMVLNPTDFSTELFTVNIAWQCAWIVAFFLLTRWRLRHPWEPATPGASGDRMRRLLKLRPHARDRSLPPISLRRNAMHIKELRGSRLGRGKARAVLWVVFFGACLFLDFENVASRYTEQMIAVLVAQHLIIALLAPAAIAPTFAKEIEQQNADMLRVTLLTPLQIAWGKFLGALSMVFTLYSAALAALIVTGLFEHVPLHYYLYFVQIAFLALFGLTLGGALGARFRRTGTALVGAYLGGFVLLFVLPWIIFMFVASFFFNFNFQNEPPLALIGAYPPVLIYTFEPGREEATIGIWGIVFATIYSLILFGLYWRVGIRSLTREPLHGG